MVMGFLMPFGSCQRKRKNEKQVIANRHTLGAARASHVCGSGNDPYRTPSMSMDSDDPYSTPSLNTGISSWDPFGTISTLTMLANEDKESIEISDSAELKHLADVENKKIDGMVNNSKRDEFLHGSGLDPFAYCSSSVSKRRTVTPTLPSLQDIPEDESLRSFQSKRFHPFYKLNS